MRFGHCKLKSPLTWAVAGLETPAYLKDLTWFSCFVVFIERPYAANRGHTKFLMPLKGFSGRQRKM